MDPLPLKDPALVFLAVIAILLAAPALDKYLRIPPVAGLIILGAAVGPYAAGILGGGEAIDLLGTIGSLFIMFIAGLEVNVGRLRRAGGKSAGFAALSFGIPFALGFLAGALVLGMTPLAAVLLGALMSTHTLVSYPIASKEGASRNRAATVSVGATIFVDSAAMALLAVVAAAHEGNTGPAFWLRFALSMAAFVACVALVLPRLAALVFRHLPSDGNVEYVIVLGILFLSAAGARLAGIVDIAGAFAAGLALSRLIPEKGVLMNRVRFTGEALFIPFFLVSVGMRIDPRIFVAGWAPWLLAVGMTGGLVLSKLAAAKAAQALFRFSRDEGNLAFGLTVNKAAAAIAIALVGFARLGLLDESLFSATIFTVAVTCVVGAVATGRSARRIAAADEGAGRTEATGRIMVPMANLETARSLVDLAFLLRSKDSQEPILPLAVVGDSETAEDDVARAEKLLAPVVVRGVAAGIPVAPVTRVSSNAAEGIVTAMRDHRATTLLLGWNGSPTIEQRLFGGVTEQVIMGTRRLVVVSRLSRPASALARVEILVPPLSERHPGFQDALECLLPACQSLALGAIVLGDPAATRAAAAYLRANSTKPFPLEERPVADWKAVFSELRAVAQSDGAAALLAARPGRLGWQPSVEKLPRKIASELPDHGMLVLYMADDRRTTRGEAASIGQPVLAEAAGAGRIRLDLDGKDWREGVSLLLALAFPEGSDEHAALLGRFGESDLRDAIELGPGVTLLHAHVEEAREPTTLIGVNHRGFPVARGDAGGEPARLVFLLLAPAGQPPEEHLKSLAAIARLVQDGRSVDALLRSRSISELVHSLSRGEGGGAK